MTKSSIHFDLLPCNGNESSLILPRVRFHNTEDEEDMVNIIHPMKESDHTARASMIESNYSFKKLYISYPGILELVIIKFH